MTNISHVEHGTYHSDKVIPGRNVTIFDPHAVQQAARGADHEKLAGKSEPRVRLIKTGDVVTAIEVRCTCGEVIRLDCEY